MQEYKSGWYVDPSFSSPTSLSSGLSYTTGFAVNPSCASCGIHGYAGEVVSDPGLLSYALPAGSGATGIADSHAKCPPPTNALLRVWVDDCATVWVNGVQTKPQRLGGVHRGSRIFSLTGLLRDEIQKALVEVEICDVYGAVSKQEETQTVQAGGSYELRFHNTMRFEEGQVHGEVEYRSSQTGSKPTFEQVAPPEAEQAPEPASDTASEPTSSQ